MTRCVCYMSRFIPSRCRDLIRSLYPEGMNLIRSLHSEGMNLEDSMVMA